MQCYSVVFTLSHLGNFHVCICTVCTHVCPDISRNNVKQRGNLSLQRIFNTSSHWDFCQTYDFQLALGDSADAVGSKVGVSRLDATQAAQVLVALLLPLGNQVLVCIAFLYTVLIQLCQETRTDRQHWFGILYTECKYECVSFVWSCANTKKGNASCMGVKALDKHLNKMKSEGLLKQLLLTYEEMRKNGIYLQKI